MTYGIDDGNGNAVAQGVSESQVDRVAQAAADRMGEPIYVYEMGSTAAPREVLPRYGRGQRMGCVGRSPFRR